MKARYYWLILTSVVLLFTIGVSAQNPVGLAEKMDNLMEHCYENKFFNGVVLVAKGDSVLFQNHYGLAVMEWDIPHTMDSKFRIASCTKQFTAMLIMQMVEEGLLDLHTPISEYLPELNNPIADSISIHHLLSHTSGLPGWREISEGSLEYWYSDKSTEDILSEFESCALEFTPGARFRYRSIGYPMLVVILEAVEKQSFEKVLQRRVFIPLGMADSGLFNWYQMKKNYAFPYEYWDYGYNISEYYNPSHAIGSTGIFSSAPDLLKWSIALDNNTLLSDSLTKKMFSPVTYRHYEGYGYGWYVGYYELEENQKRIDYQQHSGGMPGHTSLITRLPDDNITLILLNNTGHARLELINYELIRILNGFDWQMRQSLAIELDKCQSVEEVASLKEAFFDNEEGYFEGENEICGLAYKKVIGGNKELGNAIFDFCQELFPNSEMIKKYRDLANQE